VAPLPPPLLQEPLLPQLQPPVALLPLQLLQEVPLPLLHNSAVTDSLVRLPI